MRLSARRLANRTSIPVDAGRFIWQNFQAATAAQGRGSTQGAARRLRIPATPTSATDEQGFWTGKSCGAATPARDLAYTLVLGMTTADRQASQRDLIDVYRKSLAANGGPETRP